MRIKVADFVFEIANKFSYSEKFVTDYLTDEEPDYYIDLSLDFLKEKNKGSNNPVYYTEFLEIYRHICDYVAARDGILMHGAVIGFDNNAYMFTAPSGTGKTTHIRQWRKLFGDRVDVINGDKPLIRFINNEFIVYGTPWCGKEHLNKNTKAPLKGIVLLSRAAENSIERIAANELNPFLLRQVYMPRDAQSRMKTIEFADKLFTTVPLYSLGCNISPQAAQIAMECITVSR